MARESTFNKRIGIVGAGPAGCICAKMLSDEGFDVELFDKGKFLRTLLVTGGGRCNLAHNEFDFRELAKNYPRGERFLYSVFSRFGTSETLDFFKSIEVDTYVQPDGRIFPVSNSAADVREKLLNSLKKVSFHNEEVVEISLKNGGYRLKTAKGEYFFDDVVVSIGGHAGYDILKNFDLKIIEPVQSLIGLKTEADVSSLSGVKLPAVSVKVDKKSFCGDLLFTLKGVSGPVIYELSSVFARREFPFNINVKFADIGDFQSLLNSNPQKAIVNILKDFVPRSFAGYILNSVGIDETTVGSRINGKARDLIKNAIENFELTVTGKMPSGEVVTCGGIDLKEVNPKTFESKKYPGLWFCGEVLDIDGFCGGFNLQNCWSSGAIVAQSIR